MADIRLQLALDMVSSKEAIKIVESTQEYIDIIEIGTPLIKHEGLNIVKTMKSKFPDKKLLVDLKTMDVGEYESDYCFEAGADIVTVLGAADLETIKGSIGSAKKHGKEVMVDMLNVKEKSTLSNIVAALGAHYIGIHPDFDHSAAAIMTELNDIKNHAKVPMIIAGGITLENIDKILEVEPAVVVVGRSITKSNTPAMAAKAIRQKVNLANNELSTTVTYSGEINKPIGLDILKVVRTSLDNASKEQFVEAIETIINANRIFIVGHDRDGLIGRIFGMRLMHLGIETYIIGETNTPAILKEDLLISICASGKSSFVLNTTKNAKDLGVKILGVTANPKSELYTTAHHTIHIDNRNRNKRKELYNKSNRSLPMGTSFEVSSLIYLESMISEIMQHQNISESDMKKRHINI
jgi:3-hexulose-6-phosphate synthase/6-phospho-3-hexuloisomerase